MQIYNYDPATKTYLFATVADESPLEPGIFLVPAFATKIAPPVPGTNQEAVFDEVSNVWSLVAIPAPPPPPTTAELLAQAKTDKLKELHDSCANAISSGMQSMVLGASYTYPTTPRDQSNLAALVLNAQVQGAAYSAKFWCADGAGVWARRVHTAAQFIQLGQEMTTHVQTQQDHYEVLICQVATNTKAKVAAIVW